MPADTRIIFEETTPKAPMPIGFRNAQRLKQLLWAGCTITLLTVSGLVLWAASQQDAADRFLKTSSIENRVTAMKLRLSAAVETYSAAPPDFLHEVDISMPLPSATLKNHIESSADIDLAGIDYGVDSALQIWIEDPETGAIRAAGESSPFWAIRRSLDRLKAPLSAPYTDIILWDGALFVISAALATRGAEKVTRPDKLPLLVLGQRLTGKTLNEMGPDRFALQSLRVVSALTNQDDTPLLEPTEMTLTNLLANPEAMQHPHQKAIEAVSAGNGLLLRTDLNRPLAYVLWKPESAALAFLKTAALPMFGLFVALISATAWAARRIQSDANRILDHEKRANWLAHHDSLTNLPNREDFLKRMASSNVINHCLAGRAGLMLIDVTGLRDINNAVGQFGGNELIRQIGLRLRNSLPLETYLARTGGDEFDILVISDNPERELQSYSEILQNVFADDFYISDLTFHMAAAAGFASSQHDHCSIQELKRRCDLAVVEAKKTRSGTPLRYSDSLDTVLNSHRDLEILLRDAITNDDIQVVYQPIVCARSGKLNRVEALARWTPAGSDTPISPDIFIAVAEQAGLITDLGQKVLLQVCRSLQGWPQLKANINASPRELADPRFVARLIRTCRDHKIAPERLAIELTEGVLVTQPEVSRMRLNALRAAGFQVMLDDFGDGFSSIGYLRRLPFDALKIDRSFVRDLTISQESRELIVAITQIASALDMKVIGEGIETEEQAALLRATAIDEYQGYLFGKPMTFGELLNRFAEPLPVRRTLTDSYTLTA